MAQTDSPDDDVRFVGGLAYAAPLGFRPLLLDLYLPAAGPDPAPLVVFLHGGGWLRGDRAMVGPRFASWRPGPLTRLAADGFAVASVDYRLSGEARFPAQLEDVSAAVDWLAGQAGQDGYDADRIVLWGEAARGHPAAQPGLRAAGVPGLAGARGGRRVRAGRPDRAGRAGRGGGRAHRRPARQPRGAAARRPGRPGGRAPPGGEARPPGPGRGAAGP